MSTTNLNPGKGMGHFINEEKREKMFREKMEEFLDQKNPKGFHFSFLKKNEEFTWIY